MLPKINFQETEAHTQLRRHAARMKNVHLRELFSEDSDRFKKYTKCFENILLDYSKNRIDDSVWKELQSLAKECKLDEAIEAFFNGEHINETEDRAVMHTALRYQGSEPIMIDGEDVMPEVRKVLAQMKTFSEKVISGQ